MQRLILMRHADAEGRAADGDRARRLSERGREEARLMGRALAARRLRPDLALVSPAARTRETWDTVHEALGDAEVHFDPAIYDGDAGVLQRLIDAHADQAGCLILVAHNPAVHQLAVTCMGHAAASPAALDRMAVGFPTGAAAVFAVEPGGRLRFETFLTPADAAA